MDKKESPVARPGGIAINKTEDFSLDALLVINSTLLIWSVGISAFFSALSIGSSFVLSWSDWKRFPFKRVNMTVLEYMSLLGLLLAVSVLISSKIYLQISHASVKNLKTSLINERANGPVAKPKPNPSLNRSSLLSNPNVEDTQRQANDLRANASKVNVSADKNKFIVSPDVMVGKAVDLFCSILTVAAAVFVGFRKSKP